MSQVGCALATLAGLSVPGLHALRAQSAHSAPLTADDAAGGRMPELRLSPRSLAMLEADAEAVAPRTVHTVEAGVIPRAALRAELQRGIGAFLRHVRAKPAIVRGRFAGWRVIELFKQRPEIHVVALRPGDTVLKVNGRSVERPEQLKYVWDRLAEASELVIEIERNAQRRSVRYVIED